MLYFTRQLFFLLLVYLPVLVFGQQNFLELSYKTTVLSKEALSKLSKQVENPQQYEEYKNVIQNSYYLSSLLIDLKNHISIYKLDTIIANKGVNNPLNIFFVIKTPNDFISKENFFNTDLYCQGKTLNFEWVFTEEVKTINGFPCKKAIYKIDNYPYIRAWFTEKIPVSEGPYLFKGLPGLVLEAETPMMHIQIEKIKYSEKLKDFTKLKETYILDYKKEIKNQEGLTLQQLFEKEYDMVKDPKFFGEEMIQVETKEK